MGQISGSAKAPCLRRRQMHCRGVYCTADGVRTNRTTMPTPIP